VGLTIIWSRKPHGQIGPLINYLHSPTGRQFVHHLPRPPRDTGRSLAEKALQPPLANFALELVTAGPISHHQQYRRAGVENFTFFTFDIEARDRIGSP
jgi:hypothetical protein